MRSFEQPDQESLATTMNTRTSSAQTIRLYAGDWAAFVTWCRHAGAAPLPAEPHTLAAYLLALSATLSPGSLARRRAAIADRHRHHGLPAPALDHATKLALRAGRRVAKPRRKPLPTATQLARMAKRCPGDLAGLRDRALLLLLAGAWPHDGGDAGGSETAPASEASRRLGRTELVGLDAEHIRFTAAGVELTLARDGAGSQPARLLPIARSVDRGTCAVSALEDWLRTSDTRFGPLFRKVDRWGNLEHRRLCTDAIRRILAQRTPRRGHIERADPP